MTFLLTVIKSFKYLERNYHSRSYLTYELNKETRGQRYTHTSALTMNGSAIRRLHCFNEEMQLYLIVCDALHRTLHGLLRKSFGMNGNVSFFSIKGPIRINKTIVNKLSLA